MSFLDKLAASIMPPESDEDRANARRVAQACAAPNDWLSMILEHHQQIEATFSEAFSATGSDARIAAVKRLGQLLSAHANAEEGVVYPATTVEDQKAHAAMAFEEQAAAKTQLALLETLDPMSQEWRDKLEHIEGAVKHHVYKEEGTWFPKLLQELPAGESQRLTRRYTEEFKRFSGGTTFANDDQFTSRQMAAQSERPNQLN